MCVSVCVCADNNSTFVIMTSTSGMYHIAGTYGILFYLKYGKIRRPTYVTVYVISAYVQRN